MIKKSLDGAEATESLGASLAATLQGQPGGILFLTGPLGAGKTTLVRGLLRELGITGPIRSPTYTLLEPYEIGGRTLLHLDLYRLQDAAEVEQLGLLDYPPEANWWLVEWPERGQGYLPAPTVSIELSYSGSGRLATIKGLPASGLPAQS